MGEFVDELKELLSDGLMLDRADIRVVVHSFVCDAPARAFVKCVKMHSGYSSCEKCDQRGEWDKKVIFTCQEGKLRTDEGFVNRTDEDHHLPNKISPLASLPVGMVSQFPLDPMHLLYLGVTRRLLLTWIRGCDKSPVKLPENIVTDLSKHMLLLGQYIPSEFCRRPRSLSEIDRWKATEFRFFLLYGGVVVLKHALCEQLYKHFLLLFVAVTILSSSKLCQMFVDYADGLLKAFVRGVAELYGKKVVVYNIHGLLHIANDAKHYGCLENFSSFCYENQLKDIKKLVRKRNLPLQQIARRLVECELNNTTLTVQTVQNGDCVLSRVHSRGPMPDGFTNLKQYHKFEHGTLRISLSLRDSCVQLDDKSLVVVKNILHDENHNITYIVYRKFRTVDDLFIYPLCSSSLGIYRLSNLENEYSICKSKHISNKYVLLPVNMDQTEFAALPLLHL